jgi:hypothetical protein
MSEKPNLNKKSVENDLKIVYDIVAYHYKHLINLKKMQKEINKKNIFKIIQNNPGITTRGIHDIFEQNTKRYNLEIEQKAQELYDKGNINSIKEKEEFIKRNIQKPIVMRTIQLIVKELQNENIIFKQNGNFYSSKNLSINSPYITEQYRQIILEKILNPSNIYSEKELIQDLVNKFGLIILFHFITALQDIRDKSLDKVKNLYEDDIEIGWLKSVISIENMYSYFKTLIERFEKQIKYKENTQISSNLLNVIKSEYPSISSTLSDVKNYFIKQE